VKPEHIGQGKDLINRLGGKAVFTGRFAAALRALVPGLCGVSRIPYRKFLFWNALGGMVWASAFVLLGFAAGNAWHKVEHYASLVSWVLLGVGVVVVALLVLRKRRGKSSAEETAETAQTVTVVENEKTTETAALETEAPTATLTAPTAPVPAIEEPAKPRPAQLVVDDAAAP
jgi:undecaprenyl-diphosphatase